MSANFELLIEDAFRDYASGANKSIYHASATIIEIALNIIKDNPDKIDAVAEVAGKVLTGIAKSFDIPYVPQFIEDRLETYLIERAVATIKMLAQKP